MLGGLLSAVGAAHSNRRYIQAKEQMARHQRDQEFMARYLGVHGVTFERWYGGLVAVVEGGPGVPVVKRGKA